MNSQPRLGDVRTSTLVMVAPKHAHHSNGGLHRAIHPGAGAITHYYGISSRAERDVLPGSEIDRKSVV